MRSANNHFRRAHPDFALPPDYLLYESFRLDYAAYQNSGLTAAQWIFDHFHAHRNDLEEVTILDWGCGPGRVLRHLPKVFGPEGDYFGADPNLRSIQWCSEHLEKVTAVGSQLLPPLPFANGQFDLLYGISIFTHLSEAAHLPWLEELARVLETGGMALITTLGPAYEGQLTAAEREVYQSGNFVVRGNVDEGHRVFTTYLPPARLRTLVAPLFEVLTYKAGVERDWGIEQDTWVIRKR